jgi:hypothetical protein
MKYSIHLHSTVILSWGPSSEAHGVEDLPLALAQEDCENIKKNIYVYG